MFDVLENKDFVADWLQVLITCCCYGNCFDTQATAIGTLLDLVDVTLIARCEQEKSTESASHIVPLISFSDLRWIEKSNLYKVNLVLWHCFVTVEPFFMLLQMYGTVLVLSYCLNQQFIYGYSILRCWNNLRC